MLTKANIKALRKAGILCPQERKTMIVSDKMVRTAIESRAKDDEGYFESLGELIGFSGENKTRTVVRHALQMAAGPEIVRLRELIAQERIECANLAEQMADFSPAEIADAIRRRPIVTY